MRYFRVAAVSAWILAALAVAGFAVAGEQPGQAGEMNPEMEAWAKLAVPGEHHEHLARMAGKWKSQTKMWMAPGAEPLVSEGTVNSKMILGGRYLQGRFDSTFMGEPFKGISIDGYDNLLKKHVSVWIDTAGTMIMRFIGDCQEDGKVVTTVAEFMGPMGKMLTMKSVTTVLDADNHKFESWSSGPDGEMFKSMEIVHTRM